MASLCSVCAPRALEFSPAPTQSPRPQLSTAVISSQFFRQISLSKKTHLHTRTRNWIVGSVTEDREVVPVKDNRPDDTNTRLTQKGSDEPQGLSASSSEGSGGDSDRLTSRAINAIIVLGFGSYAVTKLLTIDHDYWHGWTFYEILRYAPEHNWIAYEQALQQNPVLSKMAISGIVYSIGDWIAQCYEGKSLLSLIGLDCSDRVLLGLLSMDLFLITITNFWRLFFLSKVESISNIYGELKSTFWPMLTAGWKLWPFAHLITYGVIPVEQRLLWVDCVELIWVTILSTYSNEKSEARRSEAAEEATLSNPSDSQPLENQREK
ncbi:hypothetical protein K1719_045959 [Acacia pycnantha]|nr:hypothetical protein K1719_045959 [Acacia pycnantha]